MPLFNNILSKIKNKVKDFTDGGFGGIGSGSSSLKDFSTDFDCTIIIGGNTIKNDEVLITRVETDSGMPNEAGVCVVDIKSLGYRLEDDQLQIDESFAQVKEGQPIEIKIKNDLKSGVETTVFKGFVERIECEIDDCGCVHFTVYGMDAKMWMMANKLTESRGNGKSYEEIVGSVLDNYSSQGTKGSISIPKDVQFKNTLYQIDQSDYDFLCSIADKTGSLFFVGADGKFNFCAPNKLMKPSHNISFKDDVVMRMRFSSSVWGTPQAVTVTAIDPSNPSQTISATSSSLSSIGSGKASKQVVPQNCSSQGKGTRYVNITDNSIENKEQAKARADAEYNRRNLKFVETEFTTIGNPKIASGHGVNSKGFGKPFDNQYLVTRVKHSWESEKVYTTTLYMVANKFTPQGR